MLYFYLLTERDLIPVFATMGGRVELDLENAGEEEMKSDLGDNIFSGSASPHLEEDYSTDDTHGAASAVK